MLPTGIATGLELMGAKNLERMGLWPWVTVVVPASTEPLGWKVESMEEASPVPLRIWRPCSWGSQEGLPDICEKSSI
jgi:hypothetical protein